MRFATAVLVIDMQRGFFEGETLARQQAGLVDATNELLRLARERGSRVFNVVTEHAADGSTWTLSMRDDDQGFNVTGTSQAEVVPGLGIVGAHTVRKIRDSAFHGTDLAQRLRILGISRLVVCGIEAENCVALTGRDAFAHDFRVAFAVEAIGSGKPERGRRALEDNRDEVRQPILTHAELADWWG
ncbi:MAG: cysteine hydrolase [Actinomycetales bacterium]|nr:cysteine hydrolase [Actinomycetales bacterium]